MNIKPLLAIVMVGAIQPVFAQKTIVHAPQVLARHTWTADNGNGSFSNPLFYDEFSDPDLIRVGDDYYMTGTTMHAFPGLPVLHSRDLVNWSFVSYAVDSLTLGPAFRLAEGKNIYGKGIWAPCLRFHNGIFYIFSNVNGFSTQVFTARSPNGPWKHSSMKRGFHDLSVLFDDDGKVLVVWGYDELRLAELNEDLTDVKPGTERVIVESGSGAGEGCHFYKINGKYYITNTNWDPVCYQVCLRAAKPEGPYEVNVMSAQENLGLGTGWRLANENQEAPFSLAPPVPNYVGRIPLHQGGIVQIQSGEWWGWSMMDHNSVGRLTCLSPVTWKNEWPYFGLPGNLTRTPGTWIKPNTGFSEKPQAPYRRSDDFSGAALQPVWQWNHVPVAEKWTLGARKGFLRLRSLPANDFWMARNTLTQRAMGPESIVTTEIDFTNLQAGDIAGLALLNMPYAWLGVKRSGQGFELEQFEQQLNKRANRSLDGKHVWLRVHCNFDTEQAWFSYSGDNASFTSIGDTCIMVYSGRTFQGVRYGLFNFNTTGKQGGSADFNDFIVDEPRSFALTKPIPYGKEIALVSLADSTVLVNWKDFVRPVSAHSKLAEGNVSKFRVVDRSNGRIALQSVADGGWVTVRNLGGMADVRIEKEPQGDASIFQWQDMQHGGLMLLSLFTHRFLFADPFAESLCAANAAGTRPDHKDGACFSWVVVE